MTSHIPTTPFQSLIAPGEAIRFERTGIPISSGGAKDARLGPAGEKPSGYTLVELLIALAILATIAAVAIPAYNDYIQKAKVAAAITDIRNLEDDITAYLINSGTLPNSLNDIARATLQDPWRNPYQYLNITAAKNLSQVRKDRFLVPLNSDYDLYSEGSDGLSRPPLTAAQSQDDVIRANDGGYVGLASDY